MRLSKTSCRAVLVETLVAVAVLAVALNLLVRFTSTSMLESARISNRARAALLAQEKVEDILRSRRDIAGWERMIRDGYETDAGGRYLFAESEHFAEFRWEWDIAPLDGEAGLQRVTVRVYYPDSSAVRVPGRHFELNTVMSVLHGTGGEDGS